MNKLVLSLVLGSLFLVSCTRTTQLNIEENKLLPDNNSIKVENSPNSRKWDSTNCIWSKYKNSLDGDLIETDSGIIRLLGVDAPESDPISGKDDFFAKEAKFFLDESLKGKRVCIKKDELSPLKDKYGREFGYIYNEDGDLINSSLVRWGYANVVYDYNFNLKTLLEQKETQAKEQNLGIWNSEEKSKYYGLNQFDISESKRVSYISSDIAKDFVGDNVTVKTYIQSSYDNGSEIFLNSKSQYNEKDNFTIVIKKTNAQNFSSRKIQILSFYRKKNLEVKGEIQNYKGNYRIYVENPDQIKVLE